MYQSIYNSLTIKNKRRALKARATNAERKLWQKLRNRQVLGVRFHRQFSVGKYILDFYCPVLRFAIELDGSQHLIEPKQLSHDIMRDNFLKKHDIRTLRLTNNEIFANIDGVLAEIALKIHEINPSQPPLASRGGAVD